VLSLFDYSGAWSAPFRACAEVVQVDIKLGIDIMEWDYLMTLGSDDLLAVGFFDASRWARHSHASQLATNPELTIYDIQEQLGHSSPKTTERYIKSLAEDNRLIDALDGLMPDVEGGVGEGG